MATSVKYPLANDAGFTDADNAHADDGSYATAAPAQNATVLGYWHNFAFAIPAGCGIDSISIEIQWKVSTTASIHTLGIQAYHGTTAMGTEDTTTNEPTTDTVRTKATLNGSWTVGWLNDNTTDGFRIRIRSTRGNDVDAVTCSIDYIKVTITYTEPPEAQTETETPPVDAVGTSALVTVTGGHLTDVVEATGIAELVEVVSTGAAIGTAELMTYVDITKAFLHDASSGYTDYTTPANEDTADDVALLPASIGADDAFYFLGGFVSTPEIYGLYIDVSTAGAGTYTIAWEYYNGSAWVSLNDYSITFGSLPDFKTLGINKFDFSKPSDISDVNINNFIAKWIRARYVSGTVTTQPLAEIIKMYAVGEYTEPSGTTYNVSLSEVITVTDNLTKSVNKYSGVAERITITDSLRKTITKIKADISTISDSLFKTIGIYRFDYINIYDLLAKTSGLFYRSLNDNITITDELRKIMPKYIVDNISILDELRKTFYKLSGMSDSIIISDSLVRSFLLKYMTLSDSVTIADLLQKTVKKKVSTPVALIDALRKTIKKLLGDKVTITETQEIDHIEGPPDLMYRKPVVARDEEPEEWHDITSIQRKGPSK